MEAVYVFETKEFHFTLTVEESKFFAAALKEIDNTLTWVISEVDNLGADLGTVIGTAIAGLEDAGSFIENAIDTSASAIEAAEATLAKDISNAIDDAVDTTVNAVVSGSKTVYKSLKNFNGW
ncbi:hypothetical protein NDN08_007125 [Rhodosorus marinus]|uniref:Uncharacterized protein n=1 Tax=Rhodosorus marinus TaxID=101924 RepID=A0AAV8UIL0_9RHOD|nr:hypothetical protein NDN08_007125 [Rhodosorus marinus]